MSLMTKKVEDWVQKGVGALYIVVIRIEMRGESGFPRRTRSYNVAGILSTYAWRGLRSENPPKSVRILNLPRESCSQELICQLFRLISP